MDLIVRAESEGATLINVFTVEPGNQQHLVDVLVDGTERFFSTLPGHIAGSVLKSKDGTRVINYSQWASVRDIEAMRQHPAMGPYIQQVRALASFDSAVCEVAYVR